MKYKVVYFLTKWYGSGLAYFVTGFNSNPVELVVTEETDVNANRHARFEYIITMWSEEWGFSLMQADGMNERTHKILRQIVPGEIVPRRCVNLFCCLTGQ